MTAARSPDVSRRTVIFHGWQASPLGIILSSPVVLPLLLNGVLPPLAAVFAVIATAATPTTHGKQGRAAGAEQAELEQQKQAGNQRHDADDHAQRTTEPAPAAVGEEADHAPERSATGLRHRQVCAPVSMP